MTDHDHLDHENHPEAELDAATAEGHDAHYDEAPVDDFGDPEESAHATVEEGEAALEEQEEGVPQKGSKLVLIGAMVGVVALGGGLIYTQFFTGSDTVQPMPRSEPAHVATASAASPVAVPPQNQVASNAPTSGLDDIAKLKQDPTAPSMPAAAPSAAPASAAPSATTPPPAAVPTVPTVPAQASNPTIPAPAAAPTTPAAVGAMPAIPNIPPQVAATMPVAPVASVPAATVPAATVPASVPTVPTVPAIPVGVNPPVTNGVPALVPPVAKSAAPAVTTPVNAAAPTAPIPDPAAEAKINALNAQVTALQHSLDQAMTKLNQVSTQHAPTSNAPAPNAVVPTGLPELPKLPGEAASHETAATALSDQSAPAHHKQLHTSSAKHATHAAHSSRAHNKKVASRHHHTKKTAATSHKSSNWVLRGAVPGEAWIATSASSSELRHIKVGDTVPGLGRIKSVTSTGDHWRVEGSTGSVR